MKPKAFGTRTIFALAATFIMAPLGCGDDPAMYQGEVLTFESPVSSMRASDHASNSQLDLSEEEKSDFGLVSPFGLVPFGPFPFYDYYTEPLIVPIPVAPDFAIYDYVHPFYAFAAFNPFWDDDDDGLPFGSDDD